MGAAQHDGIRPGIEQGLQARANDRFRMGPGQFAGFDQFHETLSDMLGDGAAVTIVSLGRQVFGAFQGTGRSQDADDAGPRSQGGRSRRPSVRASTRSRTAGSEGSE